jgi:hypothetical protein
MESFKKSKECSSKHINEVAVAGRQYKKKKKKKKKKKRKKKKEKGTILDSLFFYDI